MLTPKNDKKNQKMKTVVECDRHKYKKCLYYLNKDSSGQVIFFLCFSVPFLMAVTARLFAFYSCFLGFVVTTF